MYTDGSGPGQQGYTLCPNPLCDGWVWNSRRSIIHCSKCGSAMSLPAPKGKSKGKGKHGLLYSGKGDGGKSVGLDAWPALAPASRAPWNWPVPPGPLGVWAVGKKGKGKGKDQQLAGGKGPKGGQAAHPQPQHRGDDAAAHSGEAAAAKKGETDLAVARQEVQFYKNLENKGLLSPSSPQMQQAQERLRKAKERELSSRSLPQQARSLQDRIHGLDRRMEQFRQQASEVSTQICSLCDQYESLLEQHTELKEEREQACIQLSVVQKATVPNTAGLWKPVGQPSSLDKVFLSFQQELSALYPGLPQDQLEKLGASVTEMYQAAAALKPADLEQRQGTVDEAPSKKHKTGPGCLVSRHLLGAGELSGPQQFRPEHAGDVPAEDGDGDMPIDLFGDGSEEPFIEGDPEGQQQDWHAAQQSPQNLDEEEDDRISYRSGKSGRSGRSVGSRLSGDNIFPGSEARSRVAQIAARWSDFQQSGSQPSVRSNHIKPSRQQGAGKGRLSSHREGGDDEDDL